MATFIGSRYSKRPLLSHPGMTCPGQTVEIRRDDDRSGVSGDAVLVAAADVDEVWPDHPAGEGHYIRRAPEPGGPNGTDDCDLRIGLCGNHRNRSCASPRDGRA